MNDTIVGLAEEAGFMLWADEPWNPGDVVDWSSRYDEELIRFTRLVVARCLSGIEEGDLEKGLSWEALEKRINDQFGIK